MLWVGNGYVWVRLIAFLLSLLTKILSNTKKLTNESFMNTVRSQIAIATVCSFVAQIFFLKLPFWLSFSVGRFEFATVMSVFNLFFRQDNKRKNQIQNYN